MIALGVAVVLVALSSHPIPDRFRKTVLLAAPTLLMILTNLFPGSPLYGLLNDRYVVADMSDFAAIVILLGFGCGLSMANTRENGQLHKVNGETFLLLYGCHITLYASAGLSGLLIQDEWPVPLAIALFTVLWLAVKLHPYKRYVINKRRGRNLCVNCGYDLRGSSGSTECPECGYRI